MNTTEQTTITPGPLERRYRMTASTMDHPRQREYIKGFNHALRLCDSAMPEINLEIHSALVDLLRFAEIWQGNSVEISKARAALAKATGGAS